MTMLPIGLRNALSALAEGQALGVLRARHAALSEGYRGGEASSARIGSDLDAAAYALARMPATFAAMRVALSELATALPAFSPTSALDVGCGPATALFAGLDAFPFLQALTGLDHNRYFLRLAAMLLADSGAATGRQLILQSGDATRDFVAERAELVTASYALVETSETECAALAKRLWALADQALVLVEPGSRAGFARLRTARTTLIRLGAEIVAPCTHAAACPIVEPDWCHFSVRLARSRAHRLLKSADAAFEDEKYAYLVAVRSGAPAYAARIIAPVVHSKAGHRARLCSAAGITDALIGPRDDRFRAAKKWQWGDGI